MKDKKIDKPFFDEIVDFKISNGHFLSQIEQGNISKFSSKGFDVSKTKFESKDSDGHFSPQTEQGSISKFSSKGFDVSKIKFEEKDKELKTLDMEKIKKEIEKFLGGDGVLSTGARTEIEGSESIFDGVSLTIEERIKHDIPLPDALSIYDIAILWSIKKRQQKIYMDAMYLAFDRGGLKGTKCEQPTESRARYYGVFMDINIRKNDFKAWLEVHNEVLPNKCLLAKWFKSLSGQNNSNILRTEHVIDWVNKTGYKKGKLDKQIVFELHSENPKLWGKNLTTFRKWIATDEAKPAKILLPNLRRK